ncbi:2-amino-4-hydroxy-6-hydroxymethyldihydropteridine diphosphokinase [Falsirhodobacter halotolerans]|uniref:2-amino-4-hydroxy-6- hydroxymethyldihydropteridine diphosphokinase n=1 Tax=Falsirhodobacter halotolerans TaxID=1146892 RepID=UPI001FD0D3E7|nr:2-amino-4-hydroxy-6-hydroxymethyldihydropteridine diphosphokinase [Falsirhodobacter halotolerans]MCJ8138475.1 2-amino-4-hydroxy-6-hydroxymethyldihydropteridine diphosphokinase [Falsirhodobacter halotolerans]
MRAFVALGANMGDAEGAVRDALARLGPVAASPLYATPAFPAGSGPDYVNAVAEVAWDGAPDALLIDLHRIEASAGRVRADRWGARVLDLDLLALGERVEGDWAHWHALPPDRQQREAPGALILPHPRLQDRAFVLVPWSDIAPDWRHPVLDRTVAQMRDALPAGDVAAVRPLSSGHDPRK